MTELGATMAYGWIGRQFSTSERYVGVVATVLASIAVSAVGVQLGALWSMFWELIRVGNDHLSGYRAARIPWGEHLPELFVAGILLFWLIALLSYRTKPRESEFSADGPSATGLLLR